MKDKDLLLSQKLEDIDPIKERNLNERQMKLIADKQKQVSTPVIKDRTLSEVDKHIVKGGTDKIDDKVAQQLISGDDFIKKIAAKRAALKAGAKAAGKAIPAIGGLYAAMESGDAAAAVPGLDQESVGMSPQDEMKMLEEINRVGAYEKGTPEDQIRYYNKIRDLIK